MKINTLKIALGLSIIGFTVFAEPIQLRCHMDSCSWANIQNIINWITAMMVLYYMKSLISMAALIIKKIILP